MISLSRAVGWGHASLVSACALLIASCATTAAPRAADAQQPSSSALFADEAACQTLTPAAAGGAMPQSDDVMVLRYLGNSSYEVAYRGKVFLFDTYYDDQRSPDMVQIGLRTPDVTRADAIFVGHPHGDHMNGSPEISNRTGAPIYISPPGRDYMGAQGARSVRYVRGGETFDEDGYTVRTALQFHAVWDPAIAREAAQLTMAAANPPLTDAERERSLASRPLQPPPAPPPPDRDIINHGTIVYVVTFDDGFRMAFRDSPGAVHDQERALIDEIHASGGQIDLAIMGYTGPTEEYGRRVVMPAIDLYHPTIWLPGHQDNVGSVRTGLWGPTSMINLFAVMRERSPDFHGVDPIYRAPVCVNTRTRALEYNAYAR